MSVTTTFRIEGQASRRVGGLRPPVPSIGRPSLGRPSIGRPSIAKPSIGKPPLPKRTLPSLRPAPVTLLGDIREWATGALPEIVRHAELRTPPGGRARLEIALHPAAAPVIVEASEAGRIAITAETAGIGPGYQRFLGHLADRLADELDIDITLGDDGPGQATPDDRAARQAVERAHLGWLGSTLLGARDARRRGAGTIHIGLPAGLRVQVEGAIATPLGPRDDAWLERAVGDVPTAIDILPWWADATDARYHLTRALCLMWTTIRWRRPTTPDERDAMDETLGILKRGVGLDPRLPWPWLEWEELLGLRGVRDAVAAEVKVRAVELAADTDGRPVVGYRRGEVLVVHEGWVLPVPGSFGEQRTPEEWTGSDAGRTITLAAVPTGTARGPMRPDEFLDQVAGHLGSDVITREDGAVRGRARISTDGSSGIEVGVLEGYAATTGRGAAIRIAFQNPADWQWALGMWRALRPA
jgi:hypothetical protein